MNQQKNTLNSNAGMSILFSFNLFNKINTILEIKYNNM